MITVFCYAQEREFYTNMMPKVYAMFAYLVNIIKSLEGGIREGKIDKTPISSGPLGFLKKKREDVTVVFFNPKIKLRKKI